jgi:hypothetical protein
VPRRRVFRVKPVKRPVDKPKAPRDISESLCDMNAFCCACGALYESQELMLLFSCPLCPIEPWEVLFSAP